MLELTRGLSPEQLDAIAELETRVVRHDGGRLKLEWGTLRARPQNRVNDLLCWQGERLVGFLGIYRFGSSTPELTGMVDPESRRGGIGSAMLDAAMPLLRELGCESVLLVVPRVSVAGAELASLRGMQFDHSEHSLILGMRPSDDEGRSDVEVRRATPDDIAELSRLFLDGFGSGEVGSDRFTEGRSQILLVMLDGIVVGTISSSNDGGQGGIYGFVIDSAHRGRGIGATVLSRISRGLFDDGARSVRLEVEVENDRALGLYTRLGFEPSATDDYYRLHL